MSDLVERLRDPTPPHHGKCLRAADRIEALERELAAAKEALRPFADCCEYIDDAEDGEEWAKFRLLIKDYRAARAALGDGGGE